MKRNLIFHCYPRTAGQKWRRSVAHLLARWDQFDGRRIVSIATDHTTDQPEAVREAFAGRGVEFREVYNTALQEVQTFGAMLAELESDRDSITLYAHSKGCTHVADNAASHLWCDAMATACLDYPALVECVLRTKGICGSFRSTQPIGWPASPPWHFAGTWYWFRNSELFSRAWRHVPNAFWGAESYPGVHFSMQESECLFFDRGATVHLYDNGFWERNAFPMMRYWRRRLAECGFQPLCESPPNHPLTTAGIE